MLRRKLFVVIATFATATIAMCSPQAANIKASLNNNMRYSDNAFEDALLDVPDLVRKYRYPVESHIVTTEDGYTLGMHRIPRGRDANNVSYQRKPVVFLMHGLLSSSADFVIMGPGSSLAYILAEEGFDVWMGNARGNYYSRKHETMNPDAIMNTAFWRFSWDEIGNIDLPAMIDYALEVSGEQKLHYIGHSQGTTAFFVMGSLRPDYNEKIISMHALGPVAYMANNRNRLLKLIAPYSNNIASISSLIGVGEFLPNSAVYTWAGQALCRDEVVFQPICSNILFLVGGWNEKEHNSTMLPAIYGHAPAGASVRQFAHYGQGINDRAFRRYDQGSRIANYIKYAYFSPPHYDLARISTPVFLHYSDSDPLAHVKDVERLFKELGRPSGKFKVPMEGFSHIDFLYGINAKELVYNRVIKLIMTMDASVDNAFDDNGL